MNDARLKSSTRLSHVSAHVERHSGISLSSPGMGNVPLGGGVSSTPGGSVI
jgi:hypothetical protein